MLNILLFIDIIQFYRDFRFYISRNASHKPRKCLLSIVAPTKKYMTQKMYISEP